MTRLRTYCIVFLFCAAAVITSPAQNKLAFTTLVSFNGTDGSAPAYMSLVQHSDGNFYGTTAGGGANSNDICDLYSPGCGTIFKVTPAGALTALYSFCSLPSCADGAVPLGGLVLGSDGNFWGTTAMGANPNCTRGCGTVFKITLSHTPGAMTTLHSFHGYPTEGSNPAAGLVQATDGNFYGTTAYGGGGANADYGTVFKITPAGSLTTLHSFCITGACNEGIGPVGGLLQISFGLLYGTTERGGTYQGGTIYSLLP